MKILNKFSFNWFIIITFYQKIVKFLVKGKKIKKREEDRWNLNGRI